METEVELNSFLSPCHHHIFLLVIILLLLSLIFHENLLATIVKHSDVFWQDGTIWVNNGRLFSFPVLRRRNGSFRNNFLQLA